VRGRLYGRTQAGSPASGTSDELVPLVWPRGRTSESRVWGVIVEGERDGRIDATIEERRGNVASLADVGGVGVRCANRSASIPTVSVAMLVPETAFLVFDPSTSSRSKVMKTDMARQAKRYTAHRPCDHCRDALGFIVPLEGTNFCI